MALSDGTLGALITGGTALISIVLTTILKKRPARVGAYDNVQEDLNALRKEFRMYKHDQDRETDYAKQVIVHLDNEVMEIRSMMNAIPGVTLPPRKPYPVRSTVTS